jgi:hypothetical protein
MNMSPYKIKNALHDKKGEGLNAFAKKRLDGDGEYA